jgi:hypothetical protein
MYGTDVITIVRRMAKHKSVLRFAAKHFQNTFESVLFWQNTFKSVLNWVPAVIRFWVFLEHF